MKDVWSNLIRSSKTMYSVAAGIHTTFCNRFIQNFWDSSFFISLFCSMFYRFICSFFYIIHTYLFSQKYNLITAQLENAFKKIRHFAQRWCEQVWTYNVIVIVHTFFGYFMRITLNSVNIVNMTFSILFKNRVFGLTVHTVNPITTILVI